MRKGRGSRLGAHAVAKPPAACREGPPLDESDAHLDSGPIMTAKIIATRRTAALVVAMVVLLPSWPEAHEIPIEVTIQAFVKPEGDALRLLVRAPLGALRDYDFPTREPGYLQI
jgi:predicted RND superfamily exporter protein